MRTIRDLPLEPCLAVRATTSLGDVAAEAAQAGARYVVVRGATGDVKGVQLTTVASWMAEQAPTVTADALPVVDGMHVELTTTVLDALSMLATSPAAVLLVREPKFGTCRIVQRNVVELSASADASGPTRTGWLS